MRPLRNGFTWLHPDLLPRLRPQQAYWLAMQAGRGLDQMRDTTVRDDLERARSTCSARPASPPPCPGSHRAHRPGPGRLARATYWSRLRPLPGAADLLRACKRRGLAVVLASSADEPEFNALRAALDAEDAIDAATFAGDVESSKPAPDLVEAALDRVGVPAYEAVFTGDTVWDVRACQKAAVPCIGLLSGGISRDELTAAGAAEVYPGPADLLTALCGSLLGGASNP